MRLLDGTKHLVSVELPLYISNHIGIIIIEPTITKTARDAVWPPIALAAMNRLARPSLAIKDTIADVRCWEVRPAIFRANLRELRMKRAPSRGDIESASSAGRIECEKV